MQDCLALRSVFARKKRAMDKCLMQKSWLGYATSVPARRYFIDKSLTFMPHVSIAIGLRIPLFCYLKRCRIKCIFAVHGLMAAEVIYCRADAEKGFMGPTTFSSDKLL